MFWMNNRTFGARNPDDVTAVMRMLDSHDVIYINGIKADLGDLIQWGRDYIFFKVEILGLASKNNDKGERELWISC